MYMYLVWWIKILEEGFLDSWRDETWDCNTDSDNLACVKKNVKGAEWPSKLESWF